MSDDLKINDPQVKKHDKHGKATDQIPIRRENMPCSISCPAYCCESGMFIDGWDDFYQCFGCEGSVLDPGHVVRTENGWEALSIAIMRRDEHCVQF